MNHWPFWAGFSEIIATLNDTKSISHCLPFCKYVLYIQIQLMSMAVDIVLSGEHSSIHIAKSLNFPLKLYAP